MTRLPSDPAARLATLTAARKSLGRKPAIFNFVEMAAAAGMTPRNLKEIIQRDADFPVLKKGGEGIPYEFDARRVLDHLISAARSAQAERERRRARVSRLAGLGAAGGDQASGNGTAGGAGPAARDMLEEMRALEKAIDVQAKIRAEKAKQGQLIDRSAVETFLWRLLSALQAEVLAIETRIDRASKMEPAAREAVKGELASILVSMRVRLEQFIGTTNGPDAAVAGGRARTAGGRRVPRPDRGHRGAGAGAAHPA